MVVLTIVTNKTGETVYFKDPIPKVNFMKLMSCSLFNSWYNLKKKKVLLHWVIKTKMKFYRLVKYPKALHFRKIGKRNRLSIRQI